MMRPLQLLLIISVLLQSSFSFAKVEFEDLYKLRNDKEVVITVFSEKEKLRIKDAYKDSDLKENISRVFFDSLYVFLNDNEKWCEPNFIKHFKEELDRNNLNTTEKDLEEYFKILRVNHQIDDILFEILSSVNKDYFELQNLDLNRAAARPFLERSYLNENNNIQDLFSNFQQWPDEIQNCSYEEYIFIKNNIWLSKTEKSQKEAHLKSLIMKAFEEKAISLESYHKLEFLRSESDINERDLWLKHYLKIVINAKNRMVPVNLNYQSNDIEKEDNFASEKLRRFSKLTRRKLLYEKYDETQIIQLAQILQKASRRMGVDPDTESGVPRIVQEFNIQLANGQRTNYVEVIELDPQSQYNLARRLLRKDMTELQMMSNFVKVTITHEDIVMAAFETGYITHEDLEHVIRYDDLWNPEMTKWEKISGFIFKVAGYSNFFVPPPWNVATSIAIGVIEGIVDNKFFKNGADNDNPATFIE